MAEAESNIQTTEDTLLARVDGGDTQVLNNFILMSMPGEELQTRQHLLNYSPYLSDTVMKSAIYKEDVLPNAIIRDILVANPQSAKSNDVLQQLDKRFEPMPDYMMAQIMNGKDSLGKKEELEAKLAFWKQKYNIAFNRLINIYLNDTVNSESFDNLALIFKNKNTIESKYSLAFLYFQQGDINQVNTILNNIPDDFNLSNNEEAVYNDYLDYFDVIKQLKYDSLNILDLESTQITCLFNLSENSAALTEAYARNILTDAGLMNYDETVIFPDAHKSAKADNYDDVKITDENKSFLTAFPNPAKNFVILKYKLDTETVSANIKIYDVNGKFIKSININDMQNQIIISTKSFNPGIYFIVLQTSNNQKETVKLNVIR